MIASWEVVAVLVPLCSASAYTGYAYARRVAAIEQALDEPVAEPAPTPPAPRAARTPRPAPADDAIDLSERLGPFGPARHKPAS